MIGNKMLTSTEAAAFLGLKKSTLYCKVCQNRLRYYKPDGGRIYFKEEDLIAYLERNPIETDEALSEESANFLMKSK